MLIIKIHNDGTGDFDIGNYNCEVLITTSPKDLLLVAHARVEGHRRAAGWRTLVRKVLKAAIDD